MKYVITLITLSTLVSCSAQSLKVTYTEEIDLTERLKAIDNPMIQQMVIDKVGPPKKYELLASNGISLYTRFNESGQDIDDGITVIGTTGEDITYNDSNTKEYVKQTDFMSTTFLIEDTPQKFNWTITEETQQIGDYLCKKAILNKGGKESTAWFTEEIAYSTGPKDFYGLPGLIIQVNTTTTIIRAVEVSFPSQKLKLSKPNKGEKTTRDQFEKLRKEKINTLTGGQQQGSGIQVIRM